MIFKKTERLTNLVAVTCFVLILAITGCQPSKPADSVNEKLKIVCTTGMIKDAVINVTGDWAEVEGLMGPGVDPHLYKATQGDLKKLGRADIIFYNGLHLEGKMGEIFEKLGRTRKVVAIGEAIDPALLLNTSGYAGAYDPHIWFDVSLWSKAVAFIGETLQEFDSGHQQDYQERMRKYLSELTALHEKVRTAIAEIPEKQRVLITAHDAFGYFGRAYNMEVRGLQGISTVSEYGLKDVADLTDFITSRKIKAVFVESSVPRKALEAVVEGCKSKGHVVKIGGTLFSDAMGAEDSPEGTYIGMVEYNVRTIVDALK